MHMIKIQKHTGLLANALQQGPALFAPRTQKLGGSQELRGSRASGRLQPGPGTREVRIRPLVVHRKDQWEKGDAGSHPQPGSGLGWQERLCYHHYCLFISKGGGKKIKRTKSTIKTKRIALVLSPPRFLCLLPHPSPPLRGFYRFFFCLRDFLRFRIIS